MRKLIGVFFVERSSYVELGLHTKLPSVAEASHISGRTYDTCGQFSSCPGAGR